MWSLPDGSLIVEEFGGFLLISLWTEYNLYEKKISFSVMPFGIGLNWIPIRVVLFPFQLDFLIFQILNLND
jgi:hypothetical protein